MQLVRHFPQPAMRVLQYGATSHKLMLTSSVYLLLPRLGVREPVQLQIP